MPECVICRQKKHVKNYNYVKEFSDINKQTSKDINRDGMNEYVQNNMKAMYNDNSEVNTNTIDVNQMIDSSNEEVTVSTPF